jgi:hypothetical protein
MRVYLWEAGTARGVTDDPVRARRAAAGFLLSDRAAEAVVVPADFDDAVASLTTGYVRTVGRRWRGHRRGGKVVWVAWSVRAPQPEPLRAAS